MVQRVWALLLAVVVLGSQLAALAHVATVRHEQCAEHSEWIEVEGAPALASAGSVESAELRYHSLGASNSPATAHGHDHCPFTPVGRDRSALRVTSRHSSIVCLSARLPVAATDSASAVRGIPLLLLAPKGSPPVPSAPSV